MIDDVLAIYTLILFRVRKIYQRSRMDKYRRVGYANGDDERVYVDVLSYLRCDGNIHVRVGHAPMAAFYYAHYFDGEHERNLRTGLQDLIR